MTMSFRIVNLSIGLLICLSCSRSPRPSEKYFGKPGEIRIIQLDPTHGHAAATQSDQLSQIDTNVYVYAPGKEEITPYFQLIASFNNRKENPTKWNEIAYFGKDYLEKMVAEKKGNVVVLAGNNRKKIEYIEQSVHAGLNVFSDKPMVINKAGFERLKNAYQLAEEKGVILFDMMTERYSLINRIQKSLMQDTLLFGKLLTGTQDRPAIMESSVHHFYRGGKGTRPAWFFDVFQQGEGIVDVTTHLIDMTFWKSFPDEIIDYQNSVKVVSAKRWPVLLTQGEFTAATSLPEIPPSLNQYVRDSLLEVYANGSITYRINGIYAGVKVEWRAATPQDGNDLRNAYSLGTKSSLFIRQEYGQKSPKLWIQKGEKFSAREFKIQIKMTLARLQAAYPGISYAEDGKTIQIIIPSGLENSHDPTFKVFAGYLEHKDVPKWEGPNTLAKYYITTAALEMANEEK